MQAWKKHASAKVPRTEVAAAEAGDSIYVIGGYAAGGATVATVEVYNISKDEFTRGPDLPVAVNHAMAAAFDQRVFVFGGYTADGAASNRTFALEGAAWKELAPMLEGRGAGGAASDGAGKLYVVGGIGPAGLANGTMAYDTATNKWTLLAGLSLPREHLGVTSFGDKVYAVGGRVDGAIKNHAEVLDTKSGKWSLLPSMPTARGGLSAAATSNGLVVAAGGEESATFPQAEAFDIRKNTWTSLPNLPTARHGLGVVGYKTRIFVIAGGPTPGLSFSGANESIETRSLEAL